MIPSPDLSLRERSFSAAAGDDAVLIPALNCEGTIGAVVRGARRFVRLVLVVDDGSSDTTAAAAAEAGAAVISHSRNLGKGAALQSGMRWLAQRGVGRMVTMDGDGQHLSEEIPALLAESNQDRGAIVIGMRRRGSQPVSRARLFGNRFADRWVSLACRRPVEDSQSGFRVYPLAQTLALQVRSTHFGYETEVLIRAARAGLPLRSVPVRVYYPPIAERVSHFRPVLDTVRIVLIVVGLLLRLW